MFIAIAFWVVVITIVAIHVGAVVVAIKKTKKAKTDQANRRANYGY